MAKYTQKAILQTFQDMLEKMPFDRITVSAIVSKCGISSNTFYYHYRDIYDLLDVWLSIVFDRYREGVASEERWKETVKIMFHDLRNHANLVYHLFNSLSRERIERYVFESTDTTFYRLVCRKTAGIAIPEQVLHDTARYNGYAFLGFFLKFIWNRMTDDIDTEAEKLCGIFEDNIQQLRAKYPPR